MCHLNATAHFVSFPSLKTIWYTRFWTSIFTIHNTHAINSLIILKKRVYGNSTVIYPNPMPKWVKEPQRNEISKILQVQKEIQMYTRWKGR